MAKAKTSRGSELQLTMSVTAQQLRQDHGNKERTDQSMLTSTNQKHMVLASQPVILVHLVSAELLSTQILIFPSWYVAMRDIESIWIFLMWDAFLYAVNMFYYHC